MATRKRNPERADKRDFRQELTDKIVALVEEGAAPWQKPWNGDIGAAALQLPYNAASGRAYHGGNILSLMSRQMDMGSDDPRWCTYKQAEANGWQVRKGEKGTRVEYWEFERIEERERPDGTTEKVKVKLDRPRCFHAVVFNAKQIDGMPELERRAPKEQWEISQAAERVLASCGVPIFHDQADRAFYSPARDQIHLPPKESFPNQGAYYEVALHEVAHSSGHPSRMNRDLSGGFGSASYAREELRAQMCSLFLAAELGIPFNPERHAAYQASWVDALKNDKNEIFAAAKDAEKIADYVIGLSRERDKEQEQTQTIPAQKEKDMPQQETILNAAPEVQSRALGNVARDLLMGEPQAPGLAGKSLSQIDEIRKIDILQYGYQAAMNTPEGSYAKQAQAEFDRRMGKLERLPREELHVASAFLPGDSFEAAAVKEAMVWKDTRDAWQEMRDSERPVFYNRVGLVAPSLRANHLSREGKREMMYVMGVSSQHFLDHGVLSDGEREALGKVAGHAYQEHRAVRQLLLGDPFASGTGDAWHSMASLDARIQNGDATAKPEYDRRMKLLDRMPYHYMEHAQIALQDEGYEHEAGILRDAMRFQRNTEIWNALRTQGGPELREKVLREAGLDEGQANRTAGVSFERLFPKAREAFGVWVSNNPEAVSAALDAQKKVQQEIAERDRQQHEAPTVGAEEMGIYKQRQRAYEIRDGELEKVRHDALRDKGKGKEREKEKPHGQEQDAAQEQKKGKAVNSELMQLKNQHAGKDARLVMAKDGDGRAYTGEIIAETGDKVLQRVSDKYVVVHEKSKLARDVEVGSRKTLSYEKGQINVLEPSQERSRSREQEALRAGITRQYGEDSRIHSAKTDIGKYRGAIVAENETHVVQRVGKNSFVAHEKSRLSGLNLSAQKDINLAIFYTNGQAKVTPTQQLDKAQARSRNQGGRDLSR